MSRDAPVFDHLRLPIRAPSRNGCYVESGSQRPRFRILATSTLDQRARGQPRASLADQIPDSLRCSTGWLDLLLPTRRIAPRQVKHGLGKRQKHDPRVCASDLLAVELRRAGMNNSSCFHATYFFLLVAKLRIITRDCELELHENRLKRN